MIYFGDVKRDKKIHYGPRTQYEVINSEYLTNTDFLLDNIKVLASMGFDGAKELSNKLDELSRSYYRMKKGLNNIEEFESELQKAYWYQIELYGYACIYNVLNSESIKDNLLGLKLIHEMYLNNYDKFIEEFDKLANKSKEIYDEHARLGILTINNNNRETYSNNDIVSEQILNSIFD